MNNAGMHIRPSSFRTSVGDLDYRQTLLSSPLAGLTAVGDGNMLKTLALDWIPFMPPTAPIVGRITQVEDWLKSVWAKGDAAQTATAWAKALYESIQGAEYFQAARSRVFWQHKDETLDDWEWQVDFEVAALDAMAYYGLNYAGLCLFTGNPPMKRYGDAVEGWDILWPAVTAIARAGKRALISLHSYVYSDQPLDWEHQQYGVLRNFHLIDRMRQSGLYAPVVISETGSHNRWSWSGLKDYTALADMLEWVFDQYQIYPEVVSINPYDCSLVAPDGTDYWFIPPEVVRMEARYNAEHYKPAPTPVPTPTPIPIPTPVPDLYNGRTRWASYIRSTPELKQDLGNVVTTLASTAKVTISTSPLISGYVKAFLAGKEVGWIYRSNVA